MHKLVTLSNGLTLITIDLPRLESVTTLVAVGAGSRYETKKINGISHFLEHMFFKGSKKYPSAELIATLVDGVGAVNNAATTKEFTHYWIKSSSKHVELSLDILSSMIRESLLSKEEIEREKGVIVEELRMYKDLPQRYVWDLYEMLQFGDQPLGWDIGGDEKTVNSITQQNLFSYMDSLYSPKNMVLVLAGKLPQNLHILIERYFSDLPKRSKFPFKSYVKEKQSKPRVGLYYKKTDQANIVLGVEGYDRFDKNRFAARVLATILGEGMSSRLFLQVRERRGLAYHISSDHSSFVDTGMFTVDAGIKLEKVEEGLKVIRQELERVTVEKVTPGELKKAKEMIRGRLAIRAESTNFLAEYFGVNFVLDRKIQTFEQFLKQIDDLTEQDVIMVAKDLIRAEKFNLQIIGPFKDPAPFTKLLKA
ncbi:insulinase family protein [Candidatus Daviesbacteria bacterium]|nr:insulinase family protein [Candidatus Daviesbacteria bacterium]